MKPWRRLNLQLLRYYRWVLPLRKLACVSVYDGLADVCELRRTNGWLCSFVASSILDMLYSPDPNTFNGPIESTQFQFTSIKPEPQQQPTYLTAGKQKRPSYPPPVKSKSRPSKPPPSTNNHTMPSKNTLPSPWS